MTNNKDMKNHIHIEICAGDLEDILLANSFEEVDRIELNSHLEEDGLSPSPSFFLEAKKLSSKPLMVMVRPHNHGFVYSDSEKGIMLKEAQFFLEQGANGIVFGALLDTKEIDIPFCQKMISLIHAYDAEAVFHKAIDASDSLERSYQLLSQLSIDRILTSGGKSSCLEGIETLGYLSKQPGASLLMGGGVNDQTVLELLKRTSIKEIHFSLRSSVSKEEKLSSILKKLTLLQIPSSQRLFTREDDEMLKKDIYEANFYSNDEDHDRY